MIRHGIPAAAGNRAVTALNKVMPAAADKGLVVLNRVFMTGDNRAVGGILTGRIGVTAANEALMAVGAILAPARNRCVLSCRLIVLSAHHDRAGIGGDIVPPAAYK